MSTLQPAKTPNCKWCEDTGLWSGMVEDLSGKRTPIYNALCPANCPAAKQESHRQEAKRIEGLFASAGVPTLYAEARLSDFVLPIQARVKDALSKRRGIFVTGPVGVGKTHLLAAIVRELSEQSQACLFVTVPDLLAEIKATFDASQHERMTGRTEREMVKAAGNVSWLALDDLGTELPTAWVRTTMFIIVNERYNWCRPILATSNLSLAELNVDDGNRLRLGPQIASRLFEICEVITVRGSDRRERRQ